jgi:ABC-type multidrug transport system fused ATPase/permease subunit
MAVFARLLREIKPYWRTLLLATVLTFATAGIQLLPPLFQRWIIDDAIAAGDYRRLVWLVVGLVVVYLLRSVVESADMYVRHVFGQKFVYDLRLRLYDHLQRLSLSFFESRQTGELMSRLTNDVRALEQLVTHSAEFIIVDTLRLAGIIVLLLVLDSRLALWAMLPIPCLVVILRWFNTRIRPIYKRIRKDLGGINAELEENLAGIRVIQAYSQEDREYGRFEIETKKYLTDTIQAISRWSTVFPGVHFLAAAGTALVLGIGAVMVMQGQMTLGTLVAFVSYTAMFLEPINRLVEIDNSIQEAIAGGERIYEVLDSTSDIADAPDAREVPVVRGEISFEDVSFAYGGGGGEVLHNVCFSVRPGEMVALVGRSGAGKTSIANLVARFYDPTAGRVTIDGIDLRAMTLRSLRRHVVIVLQDTFLFNASVRENLLYGREEASEDEMIAAARAAYAHDFIVELPDGYDTQIGERGVKLSGGQKQRLALARAIMTDPRIIILDEATSSVDAEAEYWIQRALVEVLKGRTALVIAHRLSTIRNADKIIALEQGRIVEVGEHETLLEQEGLYSRLYEHQRRV